MALALTISFTLLLSLLFAKLEIEIEGKNGWASELPTWRLPAGSWIGRLVWGNRPVTGYHFWASLFVLGVFHFPVLFVGPSLRAELIILTSLIIFYIVEDFLWFVLNPAFGIKNFKKDKIWWHQKNWWLIAPREYFIFFAITVLLICFYFQL